MTQVVVEHSILVLVGGGPGRPLDTDLPRDSNIGAGGDGAGNWILVEKVLYKTKIYPSLIKICDL